jgi:sulfate permease, SulP family
VTQASSFTPLAPTDPATGVGVRAPLFAALDAAAFTIPLTLGSVTLVFSKIGGTAMASAIVTTLVAIALLQFTTANARRPLLFSARFFEATTLAAMMDRAIERLPAWGIGDTPQARLAVLCVVMAGAGLVVGVLFAVRADRFSRHIPTPVFAAFSNSIAFGLLLSQAGTLRELFALEGAVSALLLALAAFVAGVAIRRWLPRWPAAACALAIGLALGGSMQAAGSPILMLGSGGTHLSVTSASADFHTILAARSPQMLSWLVTNIAILGAMMFINTSITAQALSHMDERPRESTWRLLWTSLWLAISGAAGAAPLSASLQSSNAAMRHSRLSPAVLIFSTAILAIVAATGVLSMVPLAAVVGALICEAVYMVDRPSVRLLRSWAAKHHLSRQQREDLAVMALVTGTAVFMNMVAAIVAGLLLGLVLFASRHLTPPVRAVWDGTQVASNCARSRGDLQLLSQLGREIRLVELQGDLFFGTVDALDAALRRQQAEAKCIVFDWTAVRHVDSSALHTLSKFTRRARQGGTSIVHVDPALSSQLLASELAGLMADDIVAPDVDRALEHAENVLLQDQVRPALPTDLMSAIEGMSLFSGLADAERAALEAAMVERVVPPGGVIVRAGDRGDEFMVLVRGSASVLVSDGAKGVTRVAGLGRGGLIGEIAFLDAAPRSATVIAQEETLLTVLDRPAYERLSELHPQLVRKLLSNIAVYLAARLRHTTARAAARRREATPRS